MSSLHNSKQSSYKNPLLSFLVLQSVGFCIILVSFYLSSFFSLAVEKSQVLSFTSSLIFAFLFIKGARILPAICSGLFCYYYFISGRDAAISAEFALFFPLVSYIFASLYKHIKTKIDEKNHTHVLTTYVAIVGFIYPIVNASLYLLPNVQNTSHLPLFELIVLAIIGGMLTHLVLTPLLIIIISTLSSNHDVPFMELDREMLQPQFQSKQYWYWVIICSLGMLAILFSTNNIILNTVCMTLLYFVAVGLGRFGLIRPFTIASSVVVLAIHNSVQRLNLGHIDIYQFYDQLLVFAIIAALIFLLATHCVKTYLATKIAIEKERRDPYTGIYNLSQLKEDLAQYNQVILIYIDLEATLTKTLQLGHKGQAQLLKQLSEYLSDKTSFASRSYLPPFANGLLCYLPSCDHKAALHELDQLLLLLKSFQFNNNQHSIDLVRRSLVCSEIQPGCDIENIVSLLCEQYIDNQTNIFWFDSNSTDSNQVDKLSFIQEAFKNDDFELYCQPYKMLNGRNTQDYFEVLLRLNSNNQLKMLPITFFPLVNKFGLENELDMWVVKNTFKTLHEQVSDWSQIGRCSINLTAISLSFTELAEKIIDFSMIYSIPLDKICFEITESTALNNEDIAIKSIEKLRETGCYIALDDFGTGYASFDYLRRLPLDILKIDGTFIKNITDNPTDVKLVQAMSQVASSMNLITVAEFVESESHSHILEQLGIDFAQGFGIAKPRPLKEFLTFTQEKPTNMKFHEPLKLINN